LGGVHGDEIEGLIAAQGLLRELISGQLPALDVTVVPILNPDGAFRRERRNGRGVDLNRNLPTQDWSPVAATERYHPGPAAGSEPENQALMKLIERSSFSLIVSLHSWKPMLNINGSCRQEAEAVRALTGYIIEESIGYPTPGSLGTWAGHERALPTLTYEIERGLPDEEVLRVHVPAVISAIQTHQQRGRTS
jgi:protein MpaA